MRSTFRPRTFDLGVTPSNRERTLPLEMGTSYSAPIASLLDRWAAETVPFSFTLLGNAPHSLPLPRITFRGATDEPLRIGLFAGFSLEEPEALARVGEFPLRLDPSLSWLREELALSIYPIVNPPAFAGLSEALEEPHLGEALWRGSERSEIYYLERELGTRAFHGLISFFSNPNQPASISVSREILIGGIVEPVLHLPSLRATEIASIPWKKSYSLLTGADVGLEPFELRINYPLAADPGKRTLIRLVAELLREYRGFLSFRQNI